VTITVGAIIGHHIQVDSGGNLLQLSDPVKSPAWWNVLSNVVFGLSVACWLVTLAAQALSYRRSAGDRRQQLKWLMAGSAVTLITIVVAVTADSGGGSASVGGHIVLVGFLALPLCIGVAVLRYRLFDIDRIISRTLGYAIVTGLLAGLYAGLVLLASRVFQVHATGVTVAVSTLAAAALFNPLRRRVQRMVDRRFNRARYDADRTVAAFAARLKDEVEPDSVRADLVAVVYQAWSPYTRRCGSATGT
jgi:hypothetical protein